MRSVGEKKNGGGKGGKYMEKENILPAEEKKHCKGKAEINLVKENIWSVK